MFYTASPIIFIETIDAYVATIIIYMVATRFDTYYQFILVCMTPQSITSPAGSSIKSVKTLNK